jgi:prepilin-type N-terminal cleavage/methylation domain-containing protein
VNIRHKNSAFTLVELLVVVAVMGILAGILSYAMSGASQEAKVKRAQAEIEAITSILQFKLNEINLQQIAFVPQQLGPRVGATEKVRNGEEHNRVLMLARRDLARMSLPQCRADLMYPAARIQFRKSNGRSNDATQSGATKIKEPAEWGTMRRLARFVNHSGADIERAANSSVFSVSDADPLNGPSGYFASANLRAAIGQILTSTGSVDTIDLTTEPWGADLSTDGSKPWTRQYESAECLYLILASTEINGEPALNQFNSRMIANVDNDAVPEIVDPWGIPYEFIREATGYGFPFFGRRFPASSDVPLTAHPSGPDSRDYLRTDYRTSRLTQADATDDPFLAVPLVISAGPNGAFGIRRSFDLEGIVADGTAGISPRTSISVIRLAAGSGSPLPLPRKPGSYQYPDPFMAFGASEDAGGATYAVPLTEMGPRTINSWFRGQGLGAVFPNADAVDAASDNIYSVGAIGVDL